MPVLSVYPVDHVAGDPPAPYLPCAVLVPPRVIIEYHRARRLHLVPFLRAEVHLLQFRLAESFRANWKSAIAMALAGEIRAHAWQWRPETVYLGGGTPSKLDPDAFAALLTLIPGRPWPEATIEAAPGNITPEKARAPGPTLGIDRVSLGVQSFVEKEIRRTGRKHTAEIVAAEIGDPARGRHRQHQYRPDRRPLRPDRDRPGANRSTGSSASRRRTSPSTCWKWMKTAAWARRCCSAGSATARRHALATTHRRFLRIGRRAAGGHRHRALRDLQFRAARLRIAAQSEILDARALRRLRRRRPFLRWPHCGSRIPNRSRIICTGAGRRG